ncbi:MAG: GTP-binding protein [Candidatus Heimdallarchaeota archaeon]|nr:GTP-binding protein [Candidatus Heimdallarchaeota archaeon]MCK4877919.1 GTP-binding protein [Candidatus Heimdallarchaeota archaeon]
MASVDLKKKGVPVTLLGLDEAGKTSLALRLAKGKWVDNTSPTIGINFETYRTGDILLKLFDVGGHKVLRRQFWLNYAANSYGILFIFDASNRKRTEEGKEWFWYLINNLEIDRKIAFAFLANKADLDSMELDEIVQVLDLHKLSNFPNISFQIFEISVKTAMNVSNAMEWFTRKIQEYTKEQTITPKGLIISSTLGNIKLFLDFSDVNSNLISVLDLLAEVYVDEKNILREERVASIVSNYGKIVFQERGEIVISLITEPNDSQIEAQRMIELIFSYLEKREYDSKEELVDFIIQTFRIPASNCKEIQEYKL